MFYKFSKFGIIAVSTFSVRPSIAEILNPVIDNVAYEAIELSADVSCSHFSIKSRTQTPFFIKQSRVSGAPYWTVESGEAMVIPNMSSRSGVIIIYALSTVASDTLEIFTIKIN